MVSKEIQQSFRRIGGVALASVLLASCSQEWTSADKFNFSDKDTNPYAKGKAEMASGRYGMAIEAFRKALQSDPGSVKALNGLAAAYDLIGRFDLAERYYRLALNFDPSSIQSLNNLGYSYYLRGEYNKARTLFERAARVDAKNAIVAANMAALDKAEMRHQVAAARVKADAKVARKEPATSWIERTTSQVQSMVTKPDAATVEAAQKLKVEPRIVHTPKPLIEIATNEPVKVETVKPRPTPAASEISVAVAEPTESPIKVVGRPAPVTAPTAAQPTGAPRKTPVALVTTTRRPEKLEKVKPVIEETAAIEAARAGSGTTTAPKTETYALIVTPQAPAPAEPAATLKGEAQLPKLKDDVAHAVRIEQTKTKTAALGDVPVVLPEAPIAEAPAPILTKVEPEPAAKAQQLAAVPADAEPVLPEAPKPVADTAQPVLMERAPRPVADAAEPVPAEAAVRKVQEKAAEEAAQVASIKTPEPEPVPAPKHAVTSPVAPKAAAPKETPVRMAGRGDTRKPTVGDADSGKLATKEASKELAALAQSVKIEISNGAGRLNMAARMRQFLGGHGAQKMRLTNAMSFTNRISVLYFRPGHMASAKSLVSLLPVAPELRRNDEIATDLRLVLGGDLLEFDRDLIDQFK